MALSFQTVGASGGLDPRVFQGFVCEILSSGLRVALRDFCCDAGLGDSSGPVVYSGREYVGKFYLWFSGMLFPFSKEKSSMDSGRNMLRVIVLMLMLVLVGGAHTLAMRLSWFGIWGAIVVMSFLVFLMEFVICRVSWRKVISNY